MDGRRTTSQTRQISCTRLFTLRQMEGQTLLARNFTLIFLGVSAHRKASERAVGESRERGVSKGFGEGGEGRRDVADRSIRAASQPASRSACSGDRRGCTSQCTLTAGWAALTARKGEIGRAPVLKSGTSGGVRGSGTCSQAALSAASESVSRQRAWRKP